MSKIINSNRILKSPYVQLNKTAVQVNNELPPLPEPPAPEQNTEFSLLTEADMGLSEEERADLIIRRAKEEAERLINEAREDAELILDRMEENARESLIQLEREAKERGYDDGFAKGEAETEAIKEEARTLYANAVRERKQMLEAIEPEVLELVVEILTKLLTDAVDIDPQVILCLIRKGFDESRLTGDVAIHVSDDDYDETYANTDALMQHVDAGAKLEIIRDPSLKKSDCIIETQHGIIDCSLDQQFTALKKNLYYISENRQ